MGLKKCKDCGKIKKESDFYGLQGECKECSKKRIKRNWLLRREYYRMYDVKRQRENFDRIFKHRFYGIKARVNGYASRTYKVENTKMFTEDEFLKWCYSKHILKTFKRLYQEWKRNDYCRGLTPSIDRINNGRGYTLDNIRWITQSINSMKENK